MVSKLRQFESPLLGATNHQPKGDFHTRHTPSDITLQIGNLPPTHYAKGNTSNKLGKLEMADLQSAMTQFNYRPICNYRPEGPNPQKK